MMEIVMIYTDEDLKNLINTLLKLPSETEWVEFKRNNSNPEEIGEYISALSNSATLHNKPYAYLLWGIEDGTLNIVGTSFAPFNQKKGNEDLINWLEHLINPKIYFKFFEVLIDTSKVVILEIAPASHEPIRFGNERFIRQGSHKKKLQDCPIQEQALWKKFEDTPYEIQTAVENISDTDVLKLLDYPTYFKLLNLPLPEQRAHILEKLEMDSIITRANNGTWNILNLGAILLAKQLSDFRKLERKRIRVIQYKKNSRTEAETKQEREGNRGYACGFEGLISFVNNLLPKNEIIGQALRKNIPMYPELAIRELVANALIHQDFTIIGCGPMIEIFDNRIEITNPGASLIDTNRILDNPPRSRNERLASFMRRIGICEERGTGIDKVVEQTEIYQLPAPIFEIMKDNTRATLFSHRSFRNMDKSDRVRACYLHACLRYVIREDMTNSSIRERFGITAKNSAMASRIIKDTLKSNLIKAANNSAARKLMKYLPYWA